MVEKICHLLQLMRKFIKKYNKIWEVIRNLLKIGFTVNPVRDDIYLVAKLKIFI